MHIDPAWRDQQPVRVDLPLAGAGLAADGGDLSVLDRNVAGKRRRTGTIDDGTASDDCIVHGLLLCFLQWGRAPQASPVQHAWVLSRIEIRIRPV